METRAKCSCGKLKYAKPSVVEPVETRILGVSYFSATALWLPKVLMPAAIAVIFLIMVAIRIWVPFPTLNSQINKGFEIASTIQSPSSSSQLLANLSSERNGVGLTEPNVPPAIQAFRIGVEIGKTTLTHTKPSDEIAEIAAKVASNQWQTEYELGRWFVLLWTITQTPDKTSTEFWAKQQEVGEKLRVRFNQRSPMDDITKIILHDYRLN